MPIIFLSDSTRKWLHGVPLRPHETAAVLVQLACDGERTVPAPYECTRERDCYYLHRKYQPEIRVAAWCILILQFFERPRWSYHRDHWDDDDYYPRSGVPHLSDSVVLPLYLLLLAVIGWGVALEAGYEIFGMVGGVHDVPTARKVISLPVKRGSGRKTPRTLFFLTLGILSIAVLQVVGALLCQMGGVMHRPFWIAPTMTLFILLAERSTSRRYSYMLRTVPTFLGLLVVLAFAIALFTTMGFLLFSTSSEEKELYFDTFEDGLWNMFMILIGSNWPLPIIPSIQYNRGYFFFFLLFLCFVCWGFLNLIIGFIFSDMTTQRDRGERLSALDFKLNMMASFSLLDADASQVLSGASAELVLQEISERYIDWGRIVVFSAVKSLCECCFHCCFLPSEQASAGASAKKESTVLSVDSADTNTRVSVSNKVSGMHVRSNRFSGTVLGKHIMMTSVIVSDEVKILLRNLFFPVQFDILSGKPTSVSATELDGLVGDVSLEERSIDLLLWYEFPARCLSKNALNIVKQRRLEILLAEQSAQEISGGEDSNGLFKTFLKYADTKYFDAILDVFLAICSIMVLSFGAAVELLYLMLLVMILEFALRYMAKGRRRFTDSSRNVVDAAVTVLLCLLLVAAAVSGHYADPSNRFIRGLMLFRLSLIARNLTLVSIVDQKRKKFRVALKYCAKGAEDVIYLLLVMFFLAVAFCEFGVLVFGGAIQRSGSKGSDIQDSLYGQNDYWPLNFNDFSSGLGTLFTALHINNVHITCSGFEAVMATYLPRLYFTAWHSVAVLLLLNVIPAFLLNNFWKYYIAAKSEMESSSLESVPTVMSTDLSPTDELTDQQAFTSTVETIVDAGRQALSRPRFYPADQGELMISSSPGPTTLLSPGLSPDGKYADRESSIHHSESSVHVRPSVVSDWATNTWRGTTTSGESIAMVGIGARDHTLPSISECDQSPRNSERKPSKESLLARVMRYIFFMGAPLTEPLLDPDQTDRSRNTDFKLPMLQWILNKITFSGRIVDRSLLAAILVQHAKEGIRPILFSSRSASLCYIRRMKYSLLFKVTSRIILVFCCFMRPSWTYLHSFEDWNNNDKYPMTVKFLSEDTAAIVCILFLLIMLYGVGLECVYSLEAEVVTCSTQLDICVSNVEENAEGVAIPLPITFENAEPIAPNEQNDSTPFKWFRISSASLFREGAGSLVSTSTGAKDASGPLVDGVSSMSGDLRTPTRKSEPFVRATENKQDNAQTETSISLLVRKSAEVYASVVQLIGNHWFWRILLIVLLLEEILYSIYAVASGSYNNPFFAALFCMLWFDYSAFRKFRTMMSIVKRFLNMLVLLTVLVISLAIFATIIYENKKYDDGDDQYFGSFQDSLWTIFLIITSTGFPNQILPSYQDNRDSIVFFIFVVAVGAFVFLNLILLVVNSEFETGKNNLESIEKNFRSLNLQLAFEVLDIENKGFLSYNDIDELMEKLYENFSDFKKRGTPSAKMRRILVSCMDVNSSRKLTMREFNMILDVTRIKLTRNDKWNYAEICFPGITETDRFKALQSVVRHRFFLLIVDIGVLVCMCVEFASGDSIYNIKRSTSEASLSFMCAILLVELILKIFIMGRRYFRSFDRKLEFALCLTSTVVLIVTFVIPDLPLSVGVIIVRILGLTRLCLGVRNIDLFFPSLGFNSMAKIFLRVGKNLGSLTISFLVTMISFCVLGMYLFGGLINRDPERNEYAKIEESRYGENNYWPLNFNDVPSGMMTLVCILHVSDWDIITEGFTAAVGNKYPRIFFTAWYCVGVLLLLNIVKSFFMRGFFVNYEVFLSSSAPVSPCRDDTVKENKSDDQDSVTHTRPRRGTDAYIHGDIQGDLENKERELFSASIGALKFLPAEDKVFLQSRIAVVLAEGEKYHEFK